MAVVGGSAGSAVHAEWSDRRHGDLAVDALPAEALSERRRALCPLPWTWLRQVHGAEVLVVEEPGQHAGATGDALATAVPGAALAVMTADCAPVLLWSDDGVVGAAHAGWRGLYEGVVEATVGAMLDLGAGGISAALGPCISPAAYEFSPADLTTMALRFGPDVVAATADGRPALDLRAAVAAVLDACGAPLVPVLGDDPPCTASDHRYFSWRARRETERQAAVIWREP